MFQRRKTSNKPRDTSTPHGNTTAESVRNLIKKNPKYSKRINYDALKDLFTDTGPNIKLPTTPGPDDKDDEGLYTFEDKSDGEGTLVVEEGGGGVGMTRLHPQSTITVRQGDGGREGIGNIDEDAAGEEDEEGSEKGDDYADWDAYEQEV